MSSPFVASVLALSLYVSAAAAQEPQPAAGASPQGTGGNPLARVLLLPDISAIASFAAVFDGYDVEARSPRGGPYGAEGRPAFRFEEVELALQSVVDPYARADVFVAFGPEGAEVEEAYLSTLSLPAGLQVKAGKLFSPFGRHNTQHPHAWDFADAPLAHGRLLADEVLSGPGVDVGWLAPLPWYAELRLAAQDTAPAEGDEERLTGVARLHQYVSLSDATTLGLGVSAARRSEARGAFRDLGGLDLYVRARGRGRSWVTLQAEVWGRRFRNVEGTGSDAGGYGQLFFRQGPHLGYGVRYDRAPAAGEAAPGIEHRFGGLGVWYPSEFQRVRLQVSYDRAPDGSGGLEALLALEFGIGTHGAHPF